MKKNYYAVKVGNGVEDVIFDNWEDCKVFVWNYNSIYKGFATREDAKHWLKSYSEDKIIERLTKQYGAKIRRTERLKGFEKIEEDLERKYIDDHLRMFINTLIEKKKIKFENFDDKSPLNAVDVCYNGYEDCVKIGLKNKKQKE